MATGEELLVLARHAAPVNGAAFTPDGRRLVTVDRAGNLRGWDVRLQMLGEQTSLSVDAGVFDVALSPDEKQMALGSVTGAASLWDLASGQRLHTLGGGSPVYRVAFRPDGEQLATVGSDNQIRVWDVESGQELLTFSGHGAGVASGLFPGTLDVAYSPDGDRLVTAGADGVAKVWDASTGAELLALQGQEGGLLSVAYSSDGRFIATTNDQAESTIKVWDAQTGAEVHTLGGHPAHIWGVAFSPDSTTLVTGGARGVIKAWDVVTGQELYTVSDQSDDVGAIVFTPDGEYFFSTGSVPLRLRRLADGAEILTLASPFIWSADLTQDGRWLYAADVDGVVRVLAVRLEDARELAHDRLTRWWQPDECRTYLHADDCPPAPARFSSDE
jgi:WD40 repeat protein